MRPLLPLHRPLLLHSFLLAGTTRCCTCTCHTAAAGDSCRILVARPASAAQGSPRHRRDTNGTPFAVSTNFKLLQVCKLQLFQSLMSRAAAALNTLPASMPIHSTVPTYQPHPQRCHQPSLHSCTSTHQTTSSVRPQSNARAAAALSTPASMPPRPWQQSLPCCSTSHQQWLQLSQLQSGVQLLQSLITAHCPTGQARKHIH